MYSRGLGAILTVLLKIKTKKLFLFMQESPKKVVLKIIEKLNPSFILDVPCGDG
jgi:hypothetical protein